MWWTELYSIVLWVQAASNRGVVYDCVGWFRWRVAVVCSGFQPHAKHGLSSAATLQSCMQCVSVSVCVCLLHCS